MSTSRAPTAAIRAALFAREPWRCGLGRFSMVRVCSLKSHPQPRPPGAPARDPYGRPRFGSGAWWRPSFRASAGLRQLLRDAATQPRALQPWELLALETLRRGEEWTLEAVCTLRWELRDGRGRLRCRFDESLRLELGALQQEG